MSVTLIIILTTAVVILATFIPTFILNSRKKTSGEDWAIASRELPLYVVVGTQFASVFGGGIVVGHLGNAYANGIGVTIYGIFMVLPFIILSFLAKWIRSNEFSTIPDILSNFSNNNKTIRILAAIMTMLFPLGWITSQITAFGTIYSALTGIDYTVLAIVFSLVSLMFVLPAGLKTVAWTDFIFACFMAVVLIIIAVFTTDLGGGVSNIVSNSEQYMLSLSGSIDKIGLSTVFLWIFAILPGGLTNQMYYQRICAISDERKASKSLIISSAVSFIGFLWAVYMGISIRTINPAVPDGAATGWLMTQVPVFLMAGFAALLFAAMMSTVSSAVQSIVVNVTRDIMPVAKPDMTEDQGLKLSRILSIFIVAMSLVLVLRFTDTLTWLVAMNALSASTLLCPIFVSYALRNKNFITNSGIIAGIIFGAIGGVVGMILETTINYAAVGIAFSFVGIIAVSMLTRKNAVLES